MNAFATYQPVCIPYKDEFTFYSPYDIVYIESKHNYSAVYFINKPRGVLVPLNIQEVANRIPAAIFCRIHKSYIVSCCHIKSMNPEKTRVYVQPDKDLPIGRLYVQEFLGRLCILK